MKHISTLLFSLLLTTLSCNNNVDPVDNFSTSDTKVVLTHIGDSLIMPAFLDFKEKSQQLNNQLLTLKNNPTSTNLNLAIEDWKKLALAWKTASIYKQGPIENNFLENQIETIADEKQIQNTFTSNSTFNEKFIENLPNSAKGINTLEVLLIAKLNQKTNIDPITTEYMLAISENILKISTQIYNTWNNGYLKEFKEQDDRGTNSSLGKLANKMLELSYTIRDERLGAPIGTRTNDVAQPNLTDAWRSEFSNQLLLAELNAIEKTITGSTSGFQNSKRIDYITNKIQKSNSEKTLFSTTIINHLKEMKSKIITLPKPIKEMIISDKTKINDIYTDARRLQTLIEVDMVNLLGIKITFSDSDGD